MCSGILSPSRRCAHLGRSASSRAARAHHDNMLSHCLSAQAQDPSCRKFRPKRSEQVIWGAGIGKVCTSDWIGSGGHHSETRFSSRRARRREGRPHRSNANTLIRFLHEGAKQGCCAVPRSPQVRIHIEESPALRRGFCNRLRKVASVPSPRDHHRRGAQD